MREKTLAIIKPDAVEAHHSGAIITLIELNKFSILGMKKVHLTHKQAEEFYAVHKERPFFGELVTGMIKGPVIVMALEREDGIKSWRDLMGATDPAKASVGSLRAMFGTSIGSNATHGSDAPDTAQGELKFFFPELM
jgi:nucleoside-diphosphate kinase